MKSVVRRQVMSMSKILSCFGVRILTNCYRQPRDNKQVSHVPCSRPAGRSEEIDPVISVFGSYLPARFIECSGDNDS
ncbi:hypothetical protein ACOSQ2_011092 [Xanthoceras sorbifolium]